MTEKTIKTASFDELVAALDAVIKKHFADNVTSVEVKFTNLSPSTITTTVGKQYAIEKNKSARNIRNELICEVA